MEQYLQYKNLHFVQNSMEYPVTGCTPDVRCNRSSIGIPALTRKLSITYVLLENKMKNIILAIYKTFFVSKHPLKSART